jgi:hypothetical protein
MCQHLRIDTWTTVSFWTEKWTEVLSPSFSKTQVPFVIRIKTHGAKNKNFKPQVPKKCLTLKFN